MLYFILGFGLFISFFPKIITEKNAPQLLSGFNTLSKEKQAQVDLKGLLQTMRDYHFKVGGGSTLVALILYFLNWKDAAMFTVTFGPILGYFYLIPKMQEFYGEAATGIQSQAKIGVVILVVVMLGVGGMLVYGYQDNQLEISSEELIFSGMYGLEIQKEAVAELRILDRLPKITKRTNGFATQHMLKGKFRTEDGKKVHLILNARQGPFLEINRPKKPTVYFSLEQNSQTVVQQLKRMGWPLNTTSY